MPPCRVTEARFSVQVALRAVHVRPRSEQFRRLVEGRIAEYGAGVRGCLRSPRSGQSRRFPCAFDQASRHGAERDCRLPPGCDSRGRYRPDNSRVALGLARAGDGGHGERAAAGGAGTGAQGTGVMLSIDAKGGLSEVLSAVVQEGGARRSWKVVLRTASRHTPVTPRRQASEGRGRALRLLCRVPYRTVRRRCCRPRRRIGSGAGHGRAREGQRLCIRQGRRDGRQARSRPDHRQKAYAAGHLLGQRVM